MLNVKNCEASINLLLALIVGKELTPILDLDEVLFCAKHRQKLYSAADVKAKKCTSDRIGQLDLDHYRANTKAHLVQQDKNLALIGLVHALNDLEIEYHVATARVICEHTERLLNDRGVMPSLYMGRGAEGDYRKDDILKVDHLNQKFTGDKSRLLLIDDNLANCLAYRANGAQAVQVLAC